jgi:UDP-glucose 4-epimerase
MKALITGGAGFIGSHMAKRLVDAGHDVWIVDDLSTGSMRNIDPLLDKPNFHHQIGSVLDEPLVGELVDRVDVVFHLAAAVGVKLIVEKPTHTIETNLRGSENVFEAAAKKGKLVVMASTSEVYGKGIKIPYSEEDDLLLGPTTKSRWGYACSKAIDEYLIFAYQQERGLPFIVVRFFNTVGRGQTGRYGMVLPNFVRQGLAGEDITVYGTGDQQRCFADVGDVVDCVLQLVEREDAVGQVFNIGSNAEISINQLAEVVRERTGGKSQIVRVPYEQAYSAGFEDITRRVPDLRKLEATIANRPQSTIEEIIDRVIEGMHEHGDS